MEPTPQLPEGYIARLATAEDAVAVANIRYKAMTGIGSGSLAGLQSDLLAVIVAYFQEMLANNQTRMWLVLEKATNRIVSVAGYMVFQKPSSNGQPGGKYGYVSGFWTSPNHRRKGLANYLLEALIQDAKASGLVQLEVKFKAGENNLLNQLGLGSAQVLSLELNTKINSGIINLT